MKALKFSRESGPVLFEIHNELGALQEFVNGNIETFSLDDKVVLIVNEEGKLNGMKKTATLYDENGQLRDALFGPVMACEISGEDFSDITPAGMMVAMKRVKVKR